MASTPLVPILRQLRRLAAGSHAGQSDSELLGRFVRSCDEIAFEEVVRRHGPLVWGVCTRLLRDRHAAEDAFQAAFLVLSRKAGRLSQPDAVGCWLYGVARRVAGRLRGRSVPAPQPLPDIPDPAYPSPLDVVSGRELTAFLDDELGRLPERLRAPLVLCYLEGHTRDEAAVQLGWSLGTLKRRLEQGRNVLRARLERRGVGLPAAMLAAGATAITVPPGLTAATAHAASAYAAGAATIGVPAVVAEAVLQAMAPARLKWAAIVLLATGAVATGVGIVPRSAPTVPLLATVPGDQPPHAPAAARVDFYGDPLPPEAVARLGSLRFRSGHGFRSIAFSPDGKTLITGSQQSDINIYDADSGRKLSTIVAPEGDQLFGHIQIVRALPGDTAIVSSAGSRSPLGLWNLRTGQRLRTFGTNVGRNATAAASADGRLVALGTSGPLIVFDVASGQEQYRIEPLGGGQWMAAFSADGTTLATAEGVSQIRLFDGLTGKERQRLPDVPPDVLDWRRGGPRPGFVAPLRNFALAPDGKYLAWGTQYTTMVWDVVNSRKAGGWPEGCDDGTFTFSPDGKLLAASTLHIPGDIMIWELATGKELRRWRVKKVNIQSLAFSPDGRCLAGVDLANRGIKVWDVATGQLRAPSDAPDYALLAVAYSPDGKTIATGGGDSMVRLWDAQTGREVRRLDSTVNGVKTPTFARGGGFLPLPFDAVSSIAFASDGRTLTAAGRPGLLDTSGGLRWWDVQTGQMVGRIDIAENCNPRVFSPDRNVILAASVGSRDERSFLWDVVAEREIQHFGADRRFSSGAAVTPDGRRFAVAAERGTVAVWDRGTETLRKLKTPGALPVSQVAIAADGRTVAWANSGTSFGLWEAASGAVRQYITPPEEQNVRTWALAISPDGRTLAYARNETVILWDVATETERARYVGHNGYVVTLAFAPDGRSLVSGSGDSTALVWPVPAPMPVPAPADLTASWTELTGADATKAFTAHWQMIAAADRTVAFLRDRLTPIPPLDDAHRDEIRRAIADLDSPQFAVRQQATQRLRQFGELAAPLLKDALTKQPTVETRQRLDQLIEQAEAPLTAGDALQALRAVEVLERIGTAESRDVLRRLAGGASEATLTREAKAALDRAAAGASL